MNQYDDCVIVICSTPYSIRLHEKCFMKLGGKPALQHIIDRVKSYGIDIILAIPIDTKIKYLDYVHQVHMVEGNGRSPLHRMAKALKNTKYKYVIRITHDDILIDPRTMLELIDAVKDTQAGYGISPKIIEGAGVEVIDIDNLNCAAKTHTEPVEHISYFVKGIGCPNPSILQYVPREAISRPYRLTLDYYGDYVVLQAIFRALGTNTTTDQICEYLDVNPQLLQYNKLPEVTLYTCVKDGVAWIGDTINSIFQGAEDREYILVDDGSKDETLEEVLYFGAARDIKIICNGKTIGLASSSNKAIEEAKGKYIMRVDADDMIKFNTLRTMKERLETTGAVICYANYDEIDEKGHFIRRNVSAKQQHHAGCALMNKRWLNEIRFKDDIHHWDSLELFKRIEHRFPIEYIEQPLWYYRRHDKNMSGAHNSEERQKCKP